MNATKALRHEEKIFYMNKSLVSSCLSGEKIKGQ